MQTTLSQFIAARPVTDPPEPDQSVAEAFNADPSGWVPVPANRVVAWMGEEGRAAKLEMLTGAVAARFGSEQNPPSADELKLYSAVRSVFLGVPNPDTVIELQPGGPHRTLLAAAVAAGAITQADADALVARGRPDGWADATAEQVAAARARIAREAATAAYVSAAQGTYNAAVAQAEAYARGERDALPADLTGGE